MDLKFIQIPQRSLSIVTQNKLLQILQFRNIKTSINNFYREFVVLKLTDMHDFNICCIAHKFMYLRHLLPEAINDICCRNEQIHHYNTRNKKDLHPLKIITRLHREKTISFQGRNCWKKLPSDMKEHI